MSGIDRLVTCFFQHTKAHSRHFTASHVTRHRCLAAASCFKSLAFPPFALVTTLHVMVKGKAISAGAALLITGIIFGLPLTLACHCDLAGWSTRHSLAGLYRPMSLTFLRLCTLHSGSLTMVSAVIKSARWRAQDPQSHRLLYLDRTRLPPHSPKSLLSYEISNVSSRTPTHPAPSCRRYWPILLSNDCHS